MVETEAPTQEGVPAHDKEKDMRTRGPTESAIIRYHTVAKRNLAKINIGRQRGRGGGCGMKKIAICRSPQGSRRRIDIRLGIGGMIGGRKRVVVNKLISG